MLGKLKMKDSRKAVEALVALDRLLHLDHPNENRRITPEVAAENYAQFWGRVSAGTLAQHDLEAVARVADWMEGFVPAFGIPRSTRWRRADDREDGGVTQA